MAFKKRTARRRLRCDYCKKPIEIGQAFVQIEMTDEFGRVKIRNHAECDGSAKSTELARRAFGEAA